MPAPDSDSSTMAIVDSLVKSFSLVPSAAVPAIVDCVLTSTRIPSSSLFDSLLDAFSHFIKETVDYENKISKQTSCVTSFVTALCYLLKKSGTNIDALPLYIRRGYLPAMRILRGNDREILNQITELLCDVVIETNSWRITEATLVSFSMRSIGLSIDMLDNEKSAIYQWSKHSDLEGRSSKLSESDSHIVYLPEDLPLPTACHILTSLLIASQRSNQAKHCPLEPMMVNGCSADAEFGIKLHSCLCDISIHLLSQSSEHRSCAIRLLLPFIFKAFGSHDSREIFMNGQTSVLSRMGIVAKIWKCCRKMFSLGPLERRDAYHVLSLCLSHVEGCKDTLVDDGTEEFDIRDEKEFWEEIKRGLVDKEGSVRKQSLHILKVSLLQKNERQRHIGESETDMLSSKAFDTTRRGQWAEKEARSLGVGELCKPTEPCSNAQQRWEALLLLYEMLEEYGTHLVEAAWRHQISLLLNYPFPLEPSTYCTSGVYHTQLETLVGTFNWLSVLWERGLGHENPQVRCLIMQSFLEIDWRALGNIAKLIPESFVLGPFVQGLNDPVHHKDFGVKGVYSSKTIEGAEKFIYGFCKYFNDRKRAAFLCSLASIVKQEPFGRAGLMALSACIASAASTDESLSKGEPQWSETISGDMVLLEAAKESLWDSSKTDLLDILRLVIESSKHHFNLNYRVLVCERVVAAASSVICTSDVPIETVKHFISTVPRDFTDYGGRLRRKVQEWFSGCKKNQWSSSCSTNITQTLKSLCDFPEKFIQFENSSEASVTYDDEELDAWGFEAQRWARLLFLVITKENHLDSVFKFFQNYGSSISRQYNNPEWNPSKFLVLTLSLVQELCIMQEKSTDCSSEVMCDMEVVTLEYSDYLNTSEASIIFEKFNRQLIFILDELVAFTESTCSIFWSGAAVHEEAIPCSVRGKLGGPSQRRLASSTTTSVLKAILSVKTIASVLSWCAQFKYDSSLASVFTFLGNFSWKVIISPMLYTETGAEIRVAAYEALAPVLKALASAISPLGLGPIVATGPNDQSFLRKEEGKPLLDSFTLCFLQNINDLLANGVLARSRRAVLMHWKWLCLVSVLSIPYHAKKNGVHLGGATAFFSGETIRCIFVDLVESLENAGESSVLPILRSVRLVLELFTSGRMSSAVASNVVVDTQMMSQLTHSSWIFHVSCNKRKVAHIAALLSSVLHSSMFSDESMHETTDGGEGALKLFVEQILDEGTKSPRTIRLAALHLTGLWLLNPKTIKYYIKELKLLSLYGSVAFDEDFEAELAESQDARVEVSMLAKSPDPELTEAFINTELYARVAVAVLFSKLADMADKLGSAEENEDCHAAIQSGKMFLLELLDSVVNDKDLSKELYKKYSAIHRRKVRAWQMICILSRFVDEDIVQRVTSSLHICLYRNNLPAVRQFLETFAIQIYLKFPSLVPDQLIPVFRDYSMRPQALSSYVFIAANVILHANDDRVRFRHLDQLLPPIIPLLTSHHHSLRGFTQLLVYQILFKLYPPLDPDSLESLPLEKRCFEDLKLFLARNLDCVRLRESMEWFLDAFNPKTSSAPSGIFTARAKELEFECVPTSLLENVISFLNEVREDLRSAMSKDAAVIKNESLTTGESCNDHQALRDVTLDFQKKITLSKHEKSSHAVTSPDTSELYKPLGEMEKEDELLNQVMLSRSMAMERIKASRQQLILVASLIERIPNLAGLARTCEVFKTAGLAVADASIVHDKQFQLISVTAEKWVPIIEVPVSSVKVFLEQKKREGFSILGLEQTANSVPLDEYTFPRKTVLVLGREKEGIPVDIIHVLDACVEIPQLGVVRSLNVHVSGAIAVWEYTRQQRSQ